jgi:ParB-like chromosome segregation protein Spo0J
MNLRISINEEYQNLAPPYTEQDYQSLKQSIKERGQLIPITTNSGGVILDGHHRYRACQELGRECSFEEKDFEAELVEKLFVIDSNLKRRHLNT